MRLLILIILFINVTLLVQAAPCRTLDNHEICIVTIKRSAKNYWEYRARVRVDGEVKPMHVYDCRKRIAIQPNKVLELFEQDGTAEIVCSFFKPPRDAFGVASGKPGSFRGVSDPLPNLDVKNILRSR
ncbi:hypothetical protein NC981_21085 [Leptolyngbya sp. DQ-M1]|uniref:hypothetical protein n=1 Tax=Leptolyngbya sp. DQ-M1 TaxID=2933920 RepID=UPI003298B4D2